MTELYRGRPQARTLRLCDMQPSCIAARLAGFGVGYAHVELPARAFEVAAQTDEIIAAHLDTLDRLTVHRPITGLEVRRIALPHPHRRRVDRVLMTEHCNSAPDAQLLVQGAGVLFLRAGATVFALACERGDYVRLPAGMGHWFRMSGQQGFCTIRMIEDGAGARNARRSYDLRQRYRLKPVAISPS